MNPIDDLFADKPEPTTTPQQTPAAIEPPPAIAAPQAKTGNAIDDLFGEKPPPAAVVPESRPYLDRASDIPGDIADQFTQGVSTVAGAPSKILGTEEKNEFDYLIPTMMKSYGLSEDQAKNEVRKMQVKSGVMDIPMGAAQSAYSWLFGPARSMISRPIEEKTGAPKELTEFGLGLVTGRPKMVKKMPDAPGAAALREAANSNYTVAKALPIEVKDSSVARIGHHIEADLSSPTHSFRPLTAPKTFKFLEELQNPSGGTIADIDSVRRVLGGVTREVNARGRRTEDAKAARTAISMLDEHLTNLKPTDISRNEHLLPDLLKEIGEARDNYAAHIRSDIIEQAMDRAGRQAAKTGAGHNIENTLRQQFDRVLNTPSLRNNYSKHDLSLIRDMVEGTTARNTARQVGKFAPTGVVSAAGSLGLGALVGGTKGMEVLPLVGLAAKKIADTAAHRTANRVAESIGTRSPLYRNTPSSDQFVVPKRALGPVNDLVRRIQEESDQNSQRQP